MSVRTNQHRVRHRPARTKVVIVLLIIAGLTSLVARDVWVEIAVTEAGIEKMGLSLGDLAKSERVLRSRARELAESGKVDEIKRVNAELEETGQVLAVLSKQLRNEKARLLELQSSPESKILEAIGRDKRLPRKDDISGVWSMPAVLVGYTLQLEQRGKRVTGQGFYMGCLGMSDLFKVTGSIDTGLLSLSFIWPPKERQEHYYRIASPRGRIRFEEVGVRGGRMIAPRHEMPSN